MPFVLPPRPPCGETGLSPKLLAGMLSFGNGLKAELKEGFLFLWLTEGGKQGKPSAAGRRRKVGSSPVLRGRGCRKRMRRGLTVQHGLAGQ